MKRWYICKYLCIERIKMKFLICAIKARAIMKRCCRTILNKARFWRDVVFSGAPVELPGTKVPVTACLSRMQLTVARVSPTQIAKSLCRMPSQASASTSCLIPVGVYRALLEQSVRIEKKNVQLFIRTCHIWGNYHLSCGFELRGSHLALKWKPCQGRVGFGWGAIIGTFMSISAHWKHKIRFISIVSPQMGM